MSAHDALVVLGVVVGLFVALRLGQGRCRGCDVSGLDLVRVMRGGR